MNTDSNKGTNNEGYVLLKTLQSYAYIILISPIIKMFSGILEMQNLIISISKINILK